MSEEATEFVAVLQSAFSANAVPWDHPKQSVRDVLEQVLPLYESFRDDRHLGTYLPNDDRTGLAELPRTLLFLPSIVTGGAVQVPAITWRYDFAASPPQLSLYLALFQVEGGGELRALGLRFETPEMPGEQEESAHSYWHTQLCRGFARDQPFQGPHGPLCPDWLPDSYPAFPLPATDPAELLVCLFVSLYGVGFARDINVPAEVARRVYERMGL